MTQIEIAKDQIQKRLVWLEKQKIDIMTEYLKYDTNQQDVLACQNMLWGMEIAFLKTLLSTLL